MAEVVNPKEYPKWIDHPTDEVGKTKDGKSIPVRVLVQDAKEEAKLLGKVDKDKETKEPEKKWPNK